MIRDLIAALVGGLATLAIAEAIEVYIRRRQNRRAPALYDLKSRVATDAVDTRKVKEIRDRTLQIFKRFIEPHGGFVDGGLTDPKGEALERMRRRAADDYSERLQQEQLRRCPACAAWHTWYMAQLCAGGCGETFGKLKESKVRMGRPLVCQPCHERAPDDPLIEKRRRALDRRAHEIHDDYHLNPSKLPPSGAA